jgi:hypothetical protein
MGNRLRVVIVHTVYGSDAPPLTSLKPRAIKLIKDLNLPERDAEAVFRRNAAELLNFRSLVPRARPDRASAARKSSLTKARAGS